MIREWFRHQFDRVWTPFRQVSVGVWNWWMSQSAYDRGSVFALIIFVLGFFLLVFPAIRNHLSLPLWEYLLMPVVPGACVGMFPPLLRHFDGVMEDHSHIVLTVGSIATGSVFVGLAVFVGFANKTLVECLAAQDDTRLVTLLVLLVLTMGIAVWVTFAGLIYRALPPICTATRSIAASVAFVAATLAPGSFALLTYRAVGVAASQIHCLPQLMEGLSQVNPL